MEDPQWQSIGVVGILSLFLLREVLQFLKSYGKNGQIESARATATLLAELKNLTNSISNLSQCMTNLAHEMKSTQAEVRECRKDIEELQRRIR